MLTDLDELMLTIRDQESRRYMEEALVCFRSRAYRAAIVSVYVAVVYDIFGKIRVLKAESEPAAESTSRSSTRPSPLETGMS